MNFKYIVESFDSLLWLKYDEIVLKLATCRFKSIQQIVFNRYKYIYITDTVNWIYYLQHLESYAEPL